jgi:hypothetical protein
MVCEDETCLFWSLDESLRGRYYGISCWAGGGQQPISPPRRSASGYKNNRPKWKKAEKELNDKGITPETSGWTEWAKEWFYGVGDS